MEGERQGRPSPAPQSHPIASSTTQPLQKLCTVTVLHSVGRTDLVFQIAINYPDVAEGQAMPTSKTTAYEYALQELLSQKKDNKGFIMK